MKIIKNTDALERDYTPQEILHREEKIVNIMNHFQSGESSGSAKLLLLGPAGSGKTTIAKKLCIILEERYNKNRSAYVNGSRFRSEHMVLDKIIKAVKISSRSRGLSSQNIIKTLLKLLLKNDIYLTIVIDDIQECSDVRNLLGDICRIDEFEVENASQRVSLIAIARDRTILDKLDFKTREILERNICTLEKYSMKELRDILKDRIRIALNPDAISEDIICMITEIAGEKGDAWYIIELLRKSCLIAQSKYSIYVNPEHVREAKLQTYPNFPQENMVYLSKHELLCLLGIARSIREKTETNTGKSYGAYKIVCEEQEEKIKSRYQFWRYMDTLTKYEFISTSPTVGGDYGNTTIIKLPEIPARLLEDKIMVLLTNPNKNDDI